MRGLAWIVIGAVVGLIGIVMAITAPGARIFGLFLAFVGIAKAIYGFRQIASGGVTTHTGTNIIQQVRNAQHQTHSSSGSRSGQSQSSTITGATYSSRRTVLQPHDSLPPLPIKL